MADCAINDYNTYKGIEEFPYYIIKYLFSNETIWRLIAYDDSDALSADKSDLTASEKAKLIWAGTLTEDGDIDSSKYRVFQQPLTDDSFGVRNTQLRVYQREIIPTDRIKSVVLLTIEIVTTAKINGLNDTRKTRISALHQELLSMLNGAKIGGISPLFLDKTGNIKTGSIMGLNNNKNYFGYSITIGTHVSSK